MTAAQFPEIAAKNAGIENVIEALLAWISELERDDSLLEPDRLRQRIDALDRLERYPAAPRTSLHARMERLCASFEAANQRLYRSIREEIQRGAGAEAMRPWAANARDQREDEADGQRYDYLDALLSGVLQLDEPASDVAELDAEMVFYQPTPARHVFEMIRRTGLADRDVLIDLGSGLGHVALLAAICTGAHCIGIEREAAYVDCARRCADALNLDNATFVSRDVRAADLSAGTVFYLYTPFTGAMLDEALALLKRQAAVREIRICTLGPCTAITAREPWLTAIGAPKADRPALFRSV